MHRLTLLFVLICFTFAASADTMSEGVTSFPELATLSGIIAATLVVVQVIKRSARNVAWLMEIPTWVYAMLVSAGLVLVARYGLKSIEGNISQLIWQATLLAASSSGFFTWLRKPTQAPKNTAPPVLLGLVCLFSAGCVTDQAFLSATRAYHSSTEAWIDNNDALEQEDFDIRRENFETHGALLSEMESR